MQNNDDIMVRVSMKIILHAGNARNLLRPLADRLSKIEKNELSGIIAKVEEEILEAHKCHTQLIQKAASEMNLVPTVLFTHAQDTLMSAESELFFIKTISYYIKQEVNENEFS